VMAQSGVDLALWDLRGKAAGRPVAELLGGRVGEAIPTYGTFWDDPTSELADRYTAFKLHVEHRAGGDRAEAVLAAVERARKVVGPDCELMLDAWMRWDEATTLAVATAVEPLGISWIEEPLPPDDLDGYARLVERCPIPIAGGEHEFTSRAFGELIDRGLHDVLQPDVCWCGGMTELVRIYALANAAGVRVCPHRGSELWALHAIAALDRQPLAESGRDWMTWVGGQPAIEAGVIRLGDAAGFGVVIAEDELPGVLRA
jgi:L-rhamnonate dehydratase